MPDGSGSSGGWRPNSFGLIHACPAGLSAGSAACIEAKIKELQDYLARHPEMPPEESLELKSRIDKLSDKVHPGQQRLWNVTEGEKQWLANREYENARAMAAWAAYFLPLPYGSAGMAAYAQGGSLQQIQDAVDFGRSQSDFAGAWASGQQEMRPIDMRPPPQVRQKRGGGGKNSQGQGPGGKGKGGQSPAPQNNGTLPLSALPLTGRPRGAFIARLLDMIPPGGSVWDLPPVLRGFVVEEMRGGNLPPGYQGIDKFDNGVATSIKSMDMRAATYQDPQALGRTVNGYVNSLSQWNGQFAPYDGVFIPQGQYTKVLELAIPAGSMSPMQQGVIAAATQSAASSGVQITVVPIP